MSTSVISRAITADTSFDYNANRQYLMIVVEGTATLTFEGGDTVNLIGYYEPLVVPRNGFTVHNIVGKVVVISDATTLFNSTLPKPRWIPILNGWSQLAEYAGKLIDIDNLNGLVLEGYFNSGSGTFYSQSTSALATAREFQIFENGGIITCITGGVGRAITTIAQTPTTAGVFKFEFTATDITFSFNGVVVTTSPYVVGGVREADALFRVGARANGTVNSYFFFKSGLCYNHRIGNAEFKFNDGYSSDGKLARTGGGQGMTAIQFTPDTWSTITI